MRKETFKLECWIPEEDDLATRFPNMGVLRRSEYEFLRDALLVPDAFISAREATELGRPAITGVARKIRAAWEAIPEASRPNWDTTKQAAGAILCVLMEANGYRKAGDDGKGSVGQPNFTVGQLYLK